MDLKKYLFSLEKKGINLGLERTSELLKRCNNPHKKLKIIQIVGTNGKGSTSAILFKILQTNGYNVGLYTSPHLASFKERIRIDGKSIQDIYVNQFIQKYKLDIKELGASFFEVLTVMSVWFFEKLKADYAILETGLGGRFDSVTACKATSFGITSISMDHNHILGNTLEDITKEKIAAITNNSTVYISNQEKHINSLIEFDCNKKNCNYKFVETNFNINLSLQGSHQKKNASLAVAIAKDLNCNTLKINQSLKKINWYGRNQIINKKPDIIFDVAHNEQGIESFLKYLDSLSKSYDKKYLLLSLQNKKDIKRCISGLERTFDKIIYSITNDEKSMPFDNVERLFKNPIFIEKPKKAIDFTSTIATKKDLIAIVGTHYWGNTISDIFNISFDII